MDALYRDWSGTCRVCCEGDYMRFKTLHLFSGIGGGALGFQNATQEYKGAKGEFETLCGIDSDPGACEAFRKITGSRAECIDLFDRQQYIDFHDQEPPEKWNEVTAPDLKRIAGDFPDVVFTSPPCKGFSGLLPSKSAKLSKYQALNRLTVRGIRLTLEAFKEDLPALILLENVPRIKSRGAKYLTEIKQLLKFYGYVFTPDPDDDENLYHDCGPIGGLAQHRRRFLLIARNPKKLNSFVYEPVHHLMQTIGDVLSKVPLPGEGGFGKIHELPKLQWKTWMRLALIPAGGDWRDLEKIDWENYKITHVLRRGAWKMDDWDGQSGAVTGGAGVGRSNGVAAVNDPRTGFKKDTHHAIYRVQKWDEAGKTVTGAMRPNNGAPCIPDPRLPKRKSRHGSVYQVVKWDHSSPTVTGTRFGSGAPAISDPRLNQIKSRYTDKWRVQDWEGIANTVTGTQDIQSGAQSISDPRVKAQLYPSGYGVQQWDKPSTTIRSAGRVMNAPVSIDDPRLNCQPRSGTYGVLDWSESAKTITGSSDIHAGTSALADPRIPENTDQGVYIIVAPDGTWHRPMTTLELATIQSFPLTLFDGTSFSLPGNSDAKWREWIGNAVPVAAAAGMANTILLSLLANSFGDWLMASEQIWVSPDEERNEVVI